jgi:serine/threonine-protein kinase HipA
MTDRSGLPCLEACEFFEITDAGARRIIRDTAQRASDEWRDAFRQVGVTGAQARDYEPAFVHDQSEIVLGL